jgi:hypothetical protein
VTLLTAASGEQTASWDTGAQLGLFTRYFIEGMLGVADGDGGNGNGSTELSELKDFLANKVSYQARRRYSRDQVPEVLGPLDRVMLTSLAVPVSRPFSFGDPDLERSPPRGRRIDRRQDRGDNRDVFRPSTAAAPSRPVNDDQEAGDLGGLLKSLLAPSTDQEEEEIQND